MNGISARLVIQAGPKAGQIINVGASVLSFGRESNNDVIFSDPEISRRHARLMSQGDGYALEDLNSTNGTFVNGQPVHGRVALYHGDVIKLGESVQFLFEQPTAAPTGGHTRPSPVHDTPVDLPALPHPGTMPSRPPDSDPLVQASMAYQAPPSPYRGMPLDVDMPAPPPAAAPPAPPVESPAAPRRRRPWLTCAVVALVLLALCTATVFWLDAYHPDTLYRPLEPLFRLLGLMN